MVTGRPKQLRLGLVCYGGSSLAIYMHGVTKELHRLVKASALRSAGKNPTTASEAVYTRLLDALVTASDVPDLQVVVDVIAGTSAGGINGIYLAKALAGNRSQEELRRLWFTRGDMNELVVYPRKILGVPLNARVKAPLLFLRALKRSPVRGHEMTKWLYEALAEMDKTERTPQAVDSLLPAGQQLDLFVTITDFYGYQRLIALDWPGFVPEARHRQAVNFRYQDGVVDHFTDNGGLAFAARTTSSFPGAFPPVSLADIQSATGTDLGPFTKRCFRIYQLNGDDPRKTYFVDGGVLDNKPFGWAIETIIGRRAAETEVDRRLLYIEPDPHLGSKTEGGPSPDTLHAAIGALTSIPRSEPILDDLLEVTEHNRRVRRIRAVIESNFDQVAAVVRGIATPEQLAATAPKDWPWTTWNAAANDAAVTEAGLTYAIYLRVKIASVLEGFASSISGICDYPEDSNHAVLVRSAVFAWGKNRGLLDDGAPKPLGADPCEAEDEERSPTVEPPRPSDDQVAFLRAFDLGYVRRRIRFVIAAFNWWYRCVGVQSFPSRAELDQGKAILYEAVAELDALARLRVGEGAPPSARTMAEQLQDEVRTVFGEKRVGAFFADGHGIDGDDFVDEHAQPLSDLFDQLEKFLTAQLLPITPRLLARLTSLTEQWDARRRRDLVVRYLGFPIWDVLLYPIQAFSRTGESDEINVIRVSPAESELLPAPDGMPVKGVKLGHFFAFFNREARENDYLRGRLDAAEQLTRLLISSTGSDDPLKPWCKAAFEAILAEDAQELKHIEKTVEGIAKQVADL
jgi:patatin-related protein